MALQSPGDSGGEEEEVPEGPSWAALQPEAAGRRVVGWRAGSALATQDVDRILHSEKRARHEYRELHKAKRQRAAPQASDPLAGLPPTWQAFWSTVPHLDPQAAYRQLRRERQRRAKAQEQPAAAPGPPGAPEDLEEEARRLDAEVRRRKQTLAAHERACAEWDRKLARVRILDRDEGELSRRALRKLEAASYEYGIMEGKIRSSDIYFHFLHEDGKIAHARRLTSLRRSHAIMGKQLDLLKAEVRALLRAAAEAQPSSDPPPSSEHRHSAESSEGGNPPAGAAASSSPAQQAV